MQKKQVLALAPKLRDERGHYYAYHLKANDAAELLGWEYIVASPAEATTSYWPPRWKKCLQSSHMDGWPRFIRRLADKHMLRSSITKVIRDSAATDIPLILFIEDPTLRLLRLLARSLLLVPRHNISLWIHWHSPPDFTALERLRLRSRLQQIKWMMSGRAAKVTAMTEPLTKLWEQVLHQPVSVMPNPMYPIETAPPFSRDVNKVICWFAGPPHKWKGSNNIQMLLDSQHPSASELKVLFTEQADLVTGRGLTHAMRLPAVLDRETYLRWMATADLMLLPYDPNHGRDVQMSGVFAETVLVGGIPVVTEGTWMAGELRRYGLEELVVDWNADSLAAYLVTLKNSGTLAARIEPMRAQYRRYHCIESYAAAMSELLTTGV